MRLSSLLRGEWQDDRMPSSTYIVTVTKRGAEFAFFVETSRPNGEIFNDGGCIVSTQHRDGATRIVWGLHRVKFEAIIESRSILWRSVAAWGKDYVWTPRSAIKPWESQKIVFCTLPPGLPGLYFSASVCFLEPVSIIFAKKEDGKSYPATLVEWLDHTRQRCIVKWTDGTTCLRSTSEIEPALLPIE